MTTRTFVPFESLWQMRIDVPYSLFVRAGDHGWSCGQLALDGNSEVVAADDLVAQSELVAGYVAEVTARAGLTTDHLRRLVLYYVPADHDDNINVEEMRSAFRYVLGNNVSLDAVPVPHFYYDGILLEVDAFAGPTSDDYFEWVSIEAPVDELASAISSVESSQILTAHWFAPEDHLDDVAATLETQGLVHEAGAVVSAGPHSDVVRGALIQMRTLPITEVRSEIDNVRLTSRRADGVGWITARCCDGALGLVAQTERIMDSIATALTENGSNFDAVVKSTTLYVGGSSESELHEDMAVRNRRYSKPGPASTGLPVYGFADTESTLTVDITYLTDA